MCRWAAYIGDPIFLADLVTAPEHSLIEQSRSAAECKTTINADGFGLAWYAHRPEPGLYRDVYPAWSDPNLQALSDHVRSGLFLAHVRASTGTAISRNNCHPFTYKTYSFMHNGQVGGFEQFRKQVDMSIPDALYAARKGATDSEALFLIALGYLDAHPSASVTQALAHAAKYLQSLAERYGFRPALRMTAAISDGTRLWALRYASDSRAPSLYYRRSPGTAHAGQGWSIVSEPTDDLHGAWTEVPAGHICTFTHTQMHMAPFSIHNPSDQARIQENCEIAAN